ncbi:hypothetical protein Bca52824_094344 [Brassica carinata]|uniref:Pre-mRNA-splicing factor Syf1-like N-terminal HAT-repeats domain-containing protein n=1 Tax=Brassica carinata TaxID=52824 RepID=A0A8X7P5Q1_BRACI|nr:hypothetical protein Bca52824_094344 [Brassica carinata]
MASGKDSDRTLGYMTRKDTEVKLPRPTRVKNKTPAPVQITAEQILREARERQEAEIRPPKQKITDSTELSDYRLRRRKEFEDKIRRARWNIQVWMKYAQWEESQKDYARARACGNAPSRRLPEPHAVAQVRRVRDEEQVRQQRENVWDRAVTLLPRVDQLWYKYIHMEEILGNIAGARQIFERWMQWSPDQQELADDEEAETLFVAFAEFEERCKEPERARFIYKFALDHIPKGRAEDLYKKFVAFEKYGWKKLWGIRIGLEIYERAIANIPPAEEKRYWQRYIYLWINYALYEEIETEDVERTRCIQFSLTVCIRLTKQYRECLKLIPTPNFPLPKYGCMPLSLKSAIESRWCSADIRKCDRKAPKDKIFKKYIEIELQLGNIDRCRKLYERYLEWSPENCYAWSKYAELERSLAETERARAIFELAISQPALDMPNCYGRTRRRRGRGAPEEIDATERKKECIRQPEIFERANSYYKDSAPELKEERATLLEDWLNMETNFGNLGISEEAEEKKTDHKRRWLYGVRFAYIYHFSIFISLDFDNRRLKCEHFVGIFGRYEEYIDYLYPEESQTTNLKILEAAYKWKQKLASSEEDYD